MKANNVSYAPFAVKYFLKIIFHIFWCLVRSKVIVNPKTENIFDLTKKSFFSFKKIIYIFKLRKLFFETNPGHCQKTTKPPSGYC
jgi:hypothetical protein